MSRFSTAARARPTWRSPTIVPAAVIRRSSPPIFAARCLCLGHSKVRKAGARAALLVEGDTQRLPVPSDTFGVVSVAFGLRNVRDTVRGIDEMIRAARPGRQGGDPRVLAPRGRFLGPLYLDSSVICSPGVGQALAPNQDVPTIICPVASSTFLTVRRCSTSWPCAD